MKITMLFATHNGAYTLRMMLNSLVNMKIPDSVIFEVVAVCNACTDDSEDILRSYSTNLNINVIQESRPGKNIALNTGLKSISADAVLVVDDDIIVNENWLSNYYNMFEKITQYDIFGGPIYPRWLSAPPEGLREAIPVEMAYALTPNEYSTGEIDATKLFGPNMAVRMSIFSSGLKFSESIGPASDNPNYVTGSETEFLKRCQQAGFKAYFDSDCSVEHIIRPWQLSQKWLNNRAFKGGRSVVQMQIGSGKVPKKVPLLFNYPRWAILKAIKVRTKILKKTILGYQDPKDKYADWWDLYSTLGYATQYKLLCQSGIIK